MLAKTGFTPYVLPSRPIPTGTCKREECHSHERAGIMPLDGNLLMAPSRLVVAAIKHNSPPSWFTADFSNQRIKTASIRPKPSISIFRYSDFPQYRHISPSFTHDCHVGDKSCERRAGRQPRGPAPRQRLPNRPSSHSQLVSVNQHCPWGPERLYRAWHHLHHSH